MPEDIRPRSNRARTGETRNTRSVRQDSTTRLDDVLSGIGVSSEKVSGVKSYVASAVEKKVRDLDAEDAMDRVLEVAVRTAVRLRDNAGKNPALFFGGLTAAAVGVGMIIASGRERDNERPRKPTRRNRSEEDFEVE